MCRGIKKHSKRKKGRPKRNITKERDPEREGHMTGTDVIRARVVQPREGGHASRGRCPECYRGGIFAFSIIPLIKGGRVALVFEKEGGGGMTAVFALGTFSAKVPLFAHRGLTEIFGRKVWAKKIR